MYERLLYNKLELELRNELEDLGLVRCVKPKKTPNKKITQAPVTSWSAGATIVVFYLITCS